MNKYKVMIVTASRADYGLLVPLIRKMNEDGWFEVKLVITGSHLSETHGMTVEQIVYDGFAIDDTVDIHIKSDSQDNTCCSIAEGIKGFSASICRIYPDLIIVLGDRYELWCVCMAAVVHRVPIAHIHGGEVTYGAIDDCIRHSITKMAVIHFPSIELYKKRIIQMGEDPGSVFAVGALGIDNIKTVDLLGAEALSEQTGVDFSKKVALMTYHPVTLDDVSAATIQVRRIMEALYETDIFTLITMPNADAGGIHIYETIMGFVNNFPNKFRLIKNLGQRRYLSAMEHSALMLGNSSSGIIESASFRLPVVNIGDRQSGRYKPANVIDCDCSKEAILGALKRAQSSDFRDSIDIIKNPYGDGNTAGRIIRILKTVDLSNKESLLKKRFYDIKF